MASREGLEIFAVDSGDFLRASHLLDDPDIMEDVLSDIADGWEDVLEDAKLEIQLGVLSMPVAGEILPDGSPLRSSISDATHVDVEARGRQVHASISVDETPDVRGFRHAPRAINSPGWNHPIFGRGSVHQVGQPGFFSDPIEDQEAKITEVVRDALKRIINALSRGL